MNETRIEAEEIKANAWAAYKRGDERVDWTLLTRKENIMKITIKPKNSKPIVKSFSDPQKAIAWINSITAKISEHKPCAIFQKALDGKCYNCGFDEKSHR